MHAQGRVRMCNQDAPLTHCVQVFVWQRVLSSQQRQSARDHVRARLESTFHHHHYRPRHCPLRLVFLVCHERCVVSFLCKFSLWHQILNISTSVSQVQEKILLKASGMSSCSDFNTWHRDRKSADIHYVTVSCHRDRKSADTWHTVSSRAADTSVLRRSRSVPIIISDVACLPC